MAAPLSLGGLHSQLNTGLPSPVSTATARRWRHLEAAEGGTPPPLSTSPNRPFIEPAPSFHTVQKHSGQLRWRKKWTKNRERERARDAKRIGGRLNSWKVEVGKVGGTLVLSSRSGFPPCGSHMCCRGGKHLCAPNKKHKYKNKYNKKYKCNKKDKCN